MAKTPATGRRGTSERDALNEALNEDVPCFPWPRSLDPALHHIWTRTVNTKTADYWSKADIPLLEIYCRNAEDIQRLSREIKAEGEIMFNANGNPVVNPKIVVRGYAESKLMTLCTKLRLQPSSRMDTKVEANVGKKKVRAVAAARTIGEDDDNLLAGNLSLQ